MGKGCHLTSSGCGVRKPRRYGRSVRRKPGEMNGLERRYAKVLEDQHRLGTIQEFRFEGMKLRLAPKTFYDPDFFVISADGTVELHEVKGAKKVDGRWKPFVEDDAMVKIKVAAAIFPFRFKMLWFDPVAGIWVEEVFGHEEVSLTDNKENVK
jgi:hypothetical protein